jgi:ABC-type lipoprotein export system ATPase subunit
MTQPDDAGVRPTTPAIDVDHITVKFGGTSVLEACSLSIAHGTSHAILGPSGIGKSTMLAVIGLLLAPQSGNVYLFGESAPDQDGARARWRRELIRWVPQLPQLLPGRTAAENVSVAAEVGGLDPEAARDRAVIVLEQVGLASRAAIRAVRLSGGEQQRVSVACAIATDAPIILADEPTASLDQSAARSVGDALLTGVSIDRTIVIATHDVELAGMCAHQTDLRTLRRSLDS